eukprot:879157-Rhodomonas_salina.1
MIHTQTVGDQHPPRLPGGTNIRLKRNCFRHCGDAAVSAKSNTSARIPGNQSNKSTRVPTRAENRAAKCPRILREAPRVTAPWEGPGFARLDPREIKCHPPPYQCSFYQEHG